VRIDSLVSEEEWTRDATEGSCLVLEFSRLQIVFVPTQRLGSFSHGVEGGLPVRRATSNYRRSCSMKLAWVSDGFKMASMSPPFNCRPRHDWNCGLCVLGVVSKCLTSICRCQEYFMR